MTLCAEMNRRTSTSRAFKKRASASKVIEISRHLNKTRQWLERRQRWQTLLEGGLAEELAQRREELQPELDLRLGPAQAAL
jgi:hypothetical protein